MKYERPENRWLDLLLMHSPDDLPHVSNYTEYNHVKTVRTCSMKAPISRLRSKDDFQNPMPLVIICTRKTHLFLFPLGDIESEFVVRNAFMQEEQRIDETGSDRLERWQE